ncbi:MAG TPA: PilW family protein [Trinickia sp.]
MTTRRAVARRSLGEQAGHTLLEWLIAVALGLVAIGGALTLYRLQREAFSRSADAARMREAGAAALTLVGQQIQMAGYAPVEAPELRTRVTPGLFGCESARPVLSPMDGQPACAPHRNAHSRASRSPGSRHPSGSSGFAQLRGDWSLADAPGSLHPQGRASSLSPLDSDGIVVRYVDDGVATWPSASGEPTDCLGQGVTRHRGHAVIVNRFYAAKPAQRESPELYCGGNGHAITPQPLVQGVERMTFRYWLRGGVEPVGARAILPAQWADVVAVDLCVVVRGRETRARKTFLDCDGQRVQGPDAHERLALSRHLVLRNQEPAR